MENLQIDRRTGSPSAEEDSQPLGPTQAVQRGIAVQARSGTLSAIEYLKANDIPGPVISRVLSGGHTRSDDRASLPAQKKSADDAAD